MGNDFELPQMSISELTPNVTMITSGRDDETDIQSVGKDFPLTVIE